MQHRLNIRIKGQQALKTLYGMGIYMKNSPLEKQILDLINVRVSQINGCAYCLEMHYKESRSHGETEQRLYGLNAWKHFSWYTEKERVALSWAEAITRCDVPDTVYAEVEQYFTEEELVDLTLAVAAINAWNRINIPFQHVPDSH